VGELIQLALLQQPFKSQLEMVFLVAAAVLVVVLILSVVGLCMVVQVAGLALLVLEAHQYMVAMAVLVHLVVREELAYSPEVAVVVRQLQGHQVLEPQDELY
jgi:hypothetical protein